MTGVGIGVEDIPRNAQRPQEPPTTYGLKGTLETAPFVRI